MHKNPLPRNTRFDILKNDETNPFMQRRTKSYPNMPTVRGRDRNTGNKLRRINSARFESKNRIKYKPRLDINSMTMFPQLGKTAISPKISTGPSFSKIIQNLEESMDTLDENPIKKGWVRLTKERGGRVKFEYNYEEQEEKSIEANEDYHDSAQKVMASMVHRWQDYRDNQNEAYGDMSPYWNMPSLLESQSEDEDDYLDDSESEYEDN